MCELSVSLNEDGQSRQIAKDVVYALQNVDSVIVKDILGTSTKVTSAMITKINITNETLTLKTHPLVGQFLKFFSLCTEMDGSISDINQAWNQLKKMGDELIERSRNQSL
jgi:predicted RNA-binding protein